MLWETSLVPMPGGRHGQIKSRVVRWRASDPFPFLHSLRGSEKWPECEVQPLGRHGGVASLGACRRSSAAKDCRRAARSR